MLKNKYHSIIIFIALFIFIIVADRLSKNWITEHILLNDGFPVIQGFFNIVNVRNFGGAFSIFQHQKLLFISMGALVPIFLLIFLREKLSELKYLITSTMIIGGAIGNLIDRLLFGYVIDFLQFGTFPVFNIADSFITTGVILLAYFMMKEDSEKKQETNLDQSTTK